MKRWIAICLIVIAICCLGIVLDSLAQPRRRPVVASTSGVELYKDPTIEVLGILSVDTGESGEGVIERLASRLEMRAEGVGADAIIDVRHIFFHGRLYAYGTAIRTKR
jgi:uncharacterized SAM-binding protein YcdF (DUF218 family)